VQVGAEGVGVVGGMADEDGEAVGEDLFLAAGQPCSEEGERLGEFGLIAEQVAILYRPQVIPYLVPGVGAAVELRQITLPRAAIIAAVSAFRRAAAAAGAPSWYLARQRLPGAYQAMLDQVEVTVAEQPLPRLQAVGSSDTVFPFLYELSWGPRESFSPARLRRHGPQGPPSGCFPAPAMNSSGWGRWCGPWSSCTGPGWSRRSTRWPPPNWTCTVTCSDQTG
jgi:hypothetical protein